LAGILGKNVTVDEDGQWLSVGNITVFREGSIISKGPVEKDVREAMKKIYEIIIRSEQCVCCSLCIARCPGYALSLKEGSVVLDSDKCIQCGKCLGPCPAVNFREEEFTL
jgi:ferredoxin